MAYLKRKPRKINPPIEEALALLRAGVKAAAKPKGLPAHEIAKAEKRARIMRAMAPWFIPIPEPKKHWIARADVLECLIMSGLMMLIYTAGYETNAIVSTLSAAYEAVMGWAGRR